MYRVIASDMDDTLLNEKGVLSPRTVAALKRAMEAGAYVVLASGRMLEAARPFAQQVGVNAPVITYNGAMVYDMEKGTALNSLTIDLETARGICSMAEEMGIYIQVYPGEGYFAQERTKYTELYENSIKVPCGIVGKPMSQWITTGQVKLLMIGEKEDTQARIDLFSKACPGVSFMMSRPNYIEIVARGVDKRFALEKTLESLGVTAEQCLAFSDGQNDVSMLNFVGAGYCVKNASQGVQDKCRFFAPANTQDGPAQIIEEMLDKGLLGKE